LVAAVIGFVVTGFAIVIAVVDGGGHFLVVVV